MIWCVWVCGVVTGHSAILILKSTAWIRQKFSTNLSKTQIQEVKVCFKFHTKKVESILFVRCYCCFFRSTQLVSIGSIWFACMQEHTHMYVSYTCLRPLSINRLIPLICTINTQLISTNRKCAHPIAKVRSGVFIECFRFNLITRRAFLELKRWLVSIVSISVYTNSDTEIWTFPFFFVWNIWTI